MKTRVLLLTKTSGWCRIVQTVFRRAFEDVTVYEGESGDPLPPIHDWEGTLLVSFCSPWIVPVGVLLKVKRAINFHPGPPEHPGFAPYSWAMYFGNEEYGITVHEMEERVDSGQIYVVERFPVYQGDTVYRLQQRTMRHLLALCLRMVEGEQSLVPCGASWQRAPRTRQDFESLRQLRSYMPAGEIIRRIQACRYPGRPGAYFPSEGAC